MILSFLLFNFFSSGLKHLPVLHLKLFDFSCRLEENLKNIGKYELWQQRADDVKENLNNTKDELDKFDTPTSDVSEREKQKRFLNVRIYSFILW